MEFKDLMKKFLKWLQETITDARTENKEKGYNWVYKDLDYTQDLKLEEYQTFFDRESQNSEYETRYNEKAGSNKKPYAYLQNEINLVYSFHKCFAMRNTTRLQLYRNDLSMKGARIPSLINIGLGHLEHRKEHFEQDK